MLKRSVLRLRNLVYPGNRCRLRSGGAVVGESNRLRTKIDVSGKSEIVFSGCPRLRDVCIKIRGDANRLVIENDVVVSGVIELFGDGNRVRIGARSKINGVFIAAHNGTSVSIGEDCLFSTMIDIRTTDSHSIYAEDGTRINPDKDVVIENHVWIARGASIAKGSCVREGSVIGAMSFVSGVVEARSIYAGVPARQVKSGIYWRE